MGDAPRIGRRLAALSLVVVTGCTSASGRRPAPGPIDLGSPPSPGTVTTVGGAATSSPTTATDPGALPQTPARPTATDPQFAMRVAALWQAIVDGDPGEALPSFFPLAAYLQVKAIRDPAADWRQRLLAHFDEDIAALHAALGADARSAAFVSLTVPETATWVQPGQEYNRLSYWRVYGSVLVYREGGVLHRIPIASLISWRGEWYVVHLSSIR